MEELRAWILRKQRTAKLTNAQVRSSPFCSNFAYCFCIFITMDSSNAIYALLYACFAQTRYMLYQIGLVEDEVDEKQHLISGTTGPKGF